MASAVKIPANPISSARYATSATRCSGPIASVVSSFIEFLVLIFGAQPAIRRATAFSARAKRRLRRLLTHRGAGGSLVCFSHVSQLLERLVAPGAFRFSQCAAIA